MAIKYHVPILFVVVFGWIIYEGWQNREEDHEEGFVEQARRVDNIKRGIRGVIFVICA